MVNLIGVIGNYKCPVSWSTGHDITRFRIFIKGFFSKLMLVNQFYLLSCREGLSFSVRSSVKLFSTKLKVCITKG